MTFTKICHTSLKGRRKKSKNTFFKAAIIYNNSSEKYLRKSSVHLDEISFKMQHKIYCQTTTEYGIHYKRNKKLLKAAQEQKTYMETANIDTVNRCTTLQETKYYQKKSRKKFSAIKRTTRDTFFTSY